MKMKTIIKEIKKEVTLKLPETLDECLAIQCTDCVYGNGSQSAWLSGCQHRAMLGMYFAEDSTNGEPSVMQDVGACGRRQLNAREVEERFVKLENKLDEMFPTCSHLRTTIINRKNHHLVTAEFTVSVPKQ